MKTITIGEIQYQIVEYIPAEDMVGLNVFGIYSLITKLEATKDDSKLLQLVLDHIGDFCGIVDRILITKLDHKPKFAEVLGFISNPEFMKSFIDTFGGLDKIIKGTEPTAKKA